MEFVQGKELREFMESQNKKMKTNIKIRVTPEQSKIVQDICFKNGIEWRNNENFIKNLDCKYLYVDYRGICASNDIKCYNYYTKLQEIDADLFIRTNGTCEENELKNFIQSQNEIKDGINEWAKQFNDIEQKIKKKNEILKKARIRRKNQREELHKLNLKLQKCISLEEHRKVINWHIERNQSLFAEIDNLKAENIEMGKLVNLNKSALDLAVMTKDLAMNEIERKNNEIEKLKAVIEYLESKVK